MNVQRDDKLNCKEWLLNHYTFFDEIFEHNGSYYLDFCLNEEARSFIKYCCNYNIPFTHCPPYGVAIEISNLELFIKKYEFEHDEFNQELIFETHPLLKLH